MVASGVAAAAAEGAEQLHSCSQKLEGAADAACFLQKRGMKPQPPKRLFQLRLTFGLCPIHQERIWAVACLGWVLACSSSGKGGAVSCEQ